ncbi:MAG: hypothetical protein IJ532_02015 [Alphaproteobacteria bacterium]|nr:hypothetical protein [Alphaproteobacteria bacterium]
MAKEQPLFKEATFVLNKICVLPYTDEELDAIGCLGFDMAKNKDFADRYMSGLMEKCELINQHKRVPFSDLNLQLYRKVLEQPDLEQIPDWITMPDAKAAAANNLRARIIKMSQNIQKSKDNQTTAKPENFRN